MACVAAVTGRPRRFFFRKPAQSSAQVETPREASAPDFSKDGKDGAFKEFLVDGLNDLGGPGYYDAKAGKAAGVAAIGGPVGVVIGAAVEAAMRSKVDALGIRLRDSNLMTPLRFQGQATLRDTTSFWG